MSLLGMTENLKQKLQQSFPAVLISSPCPQRPTPSMFFHATGYFWFNFEMLTFTFFNFLSFAKNKDNHVGKMLKGGDDDGVLEGEELREGEQLGAVLRLQLHLQTCCMV